MVEEDKMAYQGEEKRRSLSSRGSTRMYEVLPKLTNLLNRTLIGGFTAPAGAPDVGIGPAPPTEAHAKS